MDLKPLAKGLDALSEWQANWPPFAPAPEVALDAAKLDQTLGELAERLRDNYPFFHPHYAGQMLKPPHPVAMMAYAMAMVINPNNHALDGGAATAALEREAIAQLAAMFGYEAPLAHLTSSGTVANLEALWVARSLHPGKAIAYSRQAHYTHARMGEVLGLKAIPVDVDTHGRMDLAHLERLLEQEAIGTVVATAGTTGLGAVDPVDRLVEMGRERGFRVHVDAAYGGFYRLLADLDPAMVPAAAFRAIAQADSVVIDPHKHGLQPYGCGAVLFRDASVGRFYKHDSPYTYFTSAELHLGEISLECSRAGAAAAAFWATLRCFPLRPDVGMGPVLQATRRAALDWAARIEASPSLRLVTPPDLDILNFFPVTRELTASAVSRETDRVFDALMADPVEPLYLAKLVLPQALLASRFPEIVWDRPAVTVLRSCLMKPEHAAVVPWLHDRLERELTRGI
jgi:glutamate/tyrosine decarboxylase-like PLP-dependent enzyme